MALRLRRGTDAERQSITPKQGELLYVTDTGLLYVGDGTTQGGNRVSGTIQDDASPTLSANLDLNGNDIVGNGNINIDGNITATGNINIGDGVEDNVIVGGVISSSLIPSEDGSYDLGDVNSYWREGYFEGLTVDGKISAGSITVDTIFKDDSAVLYDGLTDNLNVSSIDGDLIGSVFSEDSAVLIDAVSAEIKGNIITSSLIVNKEPTDPFPGDLAVFNGTNDIDLPFVELNIAKNSLANPSSIVPEEQIGGYRINAYTDGNFKTVTALLSVLAADADITSSNPKTDLNLVVGNNNLSTFYLFQGDGIFKVPTAIKTGTFEDETARDAAIPNPEAGMIILLTGRDDSTGRPIFQGHDGDDWRDLSD